MLCLLFVKNFIVACDGHLRSITDNANNIVDKPFLLTNLLNSKYIWAPEGQDPSVEYATVNLGFSTSPLYCHNVKFCSFIEFLIAIK